MDYMQTSLPISSRHTQGLNWNHAVSPLICAEIFREIAEELGNSIVAIVTIQWLNALKEWS
jgi:hypothetical protein